MVAIAGTLMAWSYPRLASLSSVYRLDGAAWNLAATLQKTRLRAIAEGVPFQVVFDTGQKTYQIQKDPGSGFENDGPARAIDDSGSISLSTAPTPIFNTRGTVEAAAVIILTSPSGGVRKIAAGLGGRIIVEN
ncbi:MAG: GspH/FimT family pseudopilin [Candidatus Binatia bacterium]